MYSIRFVLFTCNMSRDVFPCTRKVFCHGFIHMQHVMGFLSLSMHQKGFLSWVHSHAACHGISFSLHASERFSVKGLFTSNMSRDFFPPSCIRKVLCHGFLCMELVMGKCAGFSHGSKRSCVRNMSRNLFIFPWVYKKKKKKKWNKEVTGKERSLFIFSNCLLARFFFSFVYLSSLVGSVSHLFTQKTSTVKMLNFLFVSVSCFCLLVSMGWGGRGWGWVHFPFSLCSNGSSSSLHKDRHALQIFQAAQKRPCFWSLHQPELTPEVVVLCANQQKMFCWCRAAGLTGTEFWLTSSESGPVVVVVVHRRLQPVHSLKLQADTFLQCNWFLGW